MTRERAHILRTLIEQASASLPDDAALTGVELFPVWKSDADYVKGDRVQYNGLLYRLVPETHHSQADWTPDIVPAIWTRVDNPEEEWPEWRQPTGAQDAYSADAKVSHNEKHWINIFGDGNVWEPGVYGWEEV